MSETTFKCKCGTQLPRPPREAVEELTRKYPYRVEISVKGTCPDCGRPFWSTYTADPDGNKSFDKQRV